MSTETYEFERAVPVKRAARKGAGRKAEPNPFEAAVNEIAGQWDIAEDAPAARSSRFTLDAANGETLKQRHDKIRRALTKAGKARSAELFGDTDRVRIEMRIAEAFPDSGIRIEPLYQVTFWDRYAVAPE